jgi:predicted ester cyclase
MTTEERNKALVREITEVIWNQKRLERIPEFYSPEYVADYRPYSPERKGLEAIKGMVERAHASFPDYHEELRELIAEGDLVAVGITISGTQQGEWGGLPPTGKRVEINEIVILEIKDGKVVRQRGVADNLTALRQLGVIPPRPASADH